MSFYSIPQTTCLYPAVLPDCKMITGLTITNVRPQQTNLDKHTPYILFDLLSSACSLLSLESNTFPVCFVGDDMGPSIFCCGSVFCTVPLAGFIPVFAFLLSVILFLSIISFSKYYQICGHNILKGFVYSFKGMTERNRIARPVLTERFKQ